MSILSHVTRSTPRCRLLWATTSEASHDWNISMLTFPGACETTKHRCLEYDVACASDYFDSQVFTSSNNMQLRDQAQGKKRWVMSNTSPVVRRGRYVVSHRKTSQPLSQARLGIQASRFLHIASKIPSQQMGLETGFSYHIGQSLESECGWGGMSRGRGRGLQVLGESAEVSQTDSKPQPEY